MVKKIYNTILLLFILINLNAQQSNKAWTSNNIFQNDCFVENKGQFELFYKDLSEIRYGFQKSTDHFFFGDNFVNIRVYKKIKRTREEIEELEKGKNEEEENEAEKESIKYKYISKFVTQRWLNTNTNCQIIAENKTNHYFTYGEEKYNSYGYKKLTYKNIYKNIDIEYNIHPVNGVEYKVIIHPGGNIKDIKYSYEGDGVETTLQNNNVIIHNDYNDIHEKGLKAFYNTENSNPIIVLRNKNKNEISFTSNVTLDQTKTLVIDPWISPITSLTGTTFANYGFDVDYDEAGNLYVYGGGSTTTGGNQQVAKYDPLGNLLWTFSGFISTIPWSATVTGMAIGNFVVDKLSSKVYVGIGWLSGGTTAVRLNSAGVYDNFITNASSNFNEIWDMKFNCVTGQLIGMGGAAGSNNINLGIIDTLTGAVTTINYTGFAGSNQDIANAYIDGSGDLFVVMNSFVVAGVNNQIYKLNPPLSTFAWTSGSGSTTMTEYQNKPYATSSNGINCLAVNDSFLYFYDGTLLRAFNKFTGIAVGTSTTIVGNTNKFQSGIFANDCNEVYIGNDSSKISKYIFNGTNFIFQNHIPIATGAPNSNVYDLMYNPINNLLYVSGKSFVATVNLNSPCTTIISGGPINATNTILCPNSIATTINTPNLAASYNISYTDSATGLLLQNTTLAPNVYTDTINGLITPTTVKVTIIETLPCNFSTNISYVNISCNTFDTISICNGQSYTLNTGQVITTPGNYNDTFLSSTGLFDSAVVLVLNVVNNTTYTINPKFCAGSSYTLPDGTSVNVAGTYFNNFISSIGCDSNYLINLTQAPIYNFTITDTICNGQTYTLADGSIISSGGTYTVALTSVNGCDSIYNYNIILNPMHNFTENISLCDTQTYTLPNGNIAYSQGTYISSFKNQYGCDSIITTNVLKGNTTTYTQNINICSNNIYVLPDGTAVNAEGTYIDTIANSKGCDSIITTNLVITQLPYFSIGADTIICPTDSIHLTPNINYSSGIYLWNTGSQDTGITAHLQGQYILSISIPPCAPVSDTMVLTYGDCSCDLSLPNAFSPNNDNMNDVFKPLFRCLKTLDNYVFSIYNRWGQQVFTTANAKAGWDGTWNFRPMENGVYFYYITYTHPITNKKINFRGDITLIR